MTCKKVSNIWTTRDGVQISIKKMQDDHLVNTIGFLRRKTKAKLLKQWFALQSYLDSDPPDGAYDCANSESTGLEAVLFGTYEPIAGCELDDYIIKYFPVFQVMLKEAEKRGLDVKDNSL